MPRLAMPPAGRVRRRRVGQGGFALLELSLALLIGTLLAVWGSTELMRRADDAAARAAGVWLLEIRHAAGRLLERHFDSLAAGTPPADADGRPLYADPLAPSLAEMRGQGLLPAGFPDAAPGGLQAAIRLHRTPQCPGDGCRIDALVHATAPLRDGRGEPDMMRLAVLNEATAGLGGHATAGPAGRLRGPAFDFPNPIAPGAPALPAGTPVLWAGLDADTAGRYVRRFDTRDPQLEAPLSAAGPVSAGGRLRTAEYLELAGTADAGQPCGATPGLVSRDRRGGGLLLCQNGTWQGQDGGFGGAYAYNHRHGCFHYNGYSTANPRTGSCSCPAGYSPVIVSAGGIWSAIEGWTTGYVCVR